MAFITREYLVTQFNNFATRISLIFAKKTEIPKSVSELTNDKGYLTTIPIAKTDLLGGVKPDGTTITADADGTIHAVGGGEEGTTDYNALENKPSINNVTLSGNKTLEELGIQAKGDYVEESALSDYALVDEAGYELGLSIDGTTYIMTLELKNKEGEVLDTKTVDLPLETMVVGASYEDGQLKLTLQNGTTVDVDVSEMVSGLVSDSFTIAGIDMKDDITKEELKSALDVPASVSELPDAEDYLKVDDVETSNIDFSTYFAD